MRSFFCRHIGYVVVCCFIFFHCFCFASSLNKYPWYFEPEQIEKCWQITKGKNVLVDVIDTKIQFLSILKGKESFSKSYIYLNHRDLNEAESIHGTAMAGLIAGNRGLLECETDSKSYCGSDGKEVVAGVAPEVKIIGREWMPGGDLEQAVLDAIDLKEEIPENSYGNLIRKSDKEVKLVLLNISGGRKKLDANTGEAWAKIRDQIKDNPYFLIVAGVGNDGSNGSIAPAILRFKRASRDAIIRVGAISKYAYGEKPKMYVNSNYGKEFVDITSPGQLIPVLTLSSKVAIVNGTSEATAIVSGALALLASCHPLAAADDIKKALLDKSDEYDHLKENVDNGRVLNIYKAVKNYCQTNAPSSMLKTKPTADEQAQASLFSYLKYGRKIKKDKDTDVVFLNEINRLNKEKHFWTGYLWGVVEITEITDEIARLALKKIENNSDNNTAKNDL